MVSLYTTAHGLGASGVFLVLVHIGLDNICIQGVSWNCLFQSLFICCTNMDWGLGRWRIWTKGVTGGGSGIVMLGRYPGRATVLC